MRNNVLYNLVPLYPVRVQLTDGIYLVKRKSDFLVIDHYGVMIVGKPLRILGYSDESPLVFHLMDVGFQVDWLETFGKSDVLRKVDSTQELQAINRLRFASNNLNHWRVKNNCEHFARFVAEGIAQSIQLQNVTALGLLAGLFILANNK